MAAVCRCVTAIVLVLVLVLAQRRRNKLPPYTSADNTVIQKLVGQSV
jgi:hypothetical protein